ncbi:MAG: aminopeptidase P family N-terminal domain-containing protein [Enterocloster bolteae]
MLRERGLDGAIVSSPENFHYVTGLAGHQHTVSRQPGLLWQSCPRMTRPPPSLPPWTMRNSRLKSG